MLIINGVDVTNPIMPIQKGFEKLNAEETGKEALPVKVDQAKPSIVHQSDLDFFTLLN